MKCGQCPAAKRDKRIRSALTCPLLKKDAVVYTDPSYNCDVSMALLRMAHEVYMARLTELAQLAIKLQSEESGQESSTQQ